MKQQQQEPLAFPAVKFSDAEKNWLTDEKKAYHIVQMFDRMDYMIQRAKHTHAFTD